jgi:hypothetical protein
MRDLLKEAGSQGMSTTEWNLAMAKFGMRTGRITELRKTLESSGEVVSVEFPRAGATRGKPRVQWYWWEYQLPGAVNLHVDPVTSAAHPEAAASTPLADAPTATPEGYTNGYANGNGNGALLSFLTEPPQLPPAALAKKLFGGPRSED